MEVIQIALPKEAVEFLREKVTSGEYANESEVILHSLQALREHAPLDWQDLEPTDDEPQTPEYELWLRKVVGPTYDLVMDNPSLLIPAEEVIRLLESQESQCPLQPL